MAGAEQVHTMKSLLKWIGVALGAFVAFVLFVAMTNAGKPSKYDYRPLLEASLKDPGSASYRNEEVRERSDGAVIYCGEVNAKNTFGGYVGFQRFVISGGSIQMESPTFTPEARERFEMRWIDVCL